MKMFQVSDELPAAQYTYIFSHSRCFMFKWPVIALSLSIHMFTNNSDLPIPAVQSCCYCIDDKKTIPALPQASPSGNRQYCHDILRQ